MSQLTDNLNLIASIKRDIKSAIENKGVDMTNVSFPDYPAAIASIQAGGGYTEQEITEGVQITDLNNSASYVHPYVFEKDSYIQTVNLPNCTVVNENAFAYCSNLTTVNLPVCTSIGCSAFTFCSSLTNINMPLITNISNTGFSGCTSLLQVSLPKCETIGNYTFANCTSLSQVSLPVCVSIVNYAFQSCISLNSLTLCTDVYWTIPYQGNMLSKTPIMSGSGSIYVRSDTYSLWITSTGWSSLADRFVSVETSGTLLAFSEGTVYGTTEVLMPNFTNYIGVSITDVVNLSLENCKTIYYKALNKYSNLTTVSLPECKIISDAAFQDCKNLSILSLPKCEVIRSSAFQGIMQSVQAYVSINLPVCSYIGNQAFFWAQKLKSITLGSTSVCVLGGNQVFTTTNINNGSIFVPVSLVDAYKSAQYWSHYSSRIFPIPE